MPAIAAIRHVSRIAHELPIGSQIGFAVMVLGFRGRPGRPPGSGARSRPRSDDRPTTLRASRGLRGHGPRAHRCRRRRHPLRSPNVAAPQLKGATSMPYGDFINQIPALGFLAIHATAFLIGAFFAWRSFGAGASLLGWGFSLFALAELSYMTYHLDWTVFLFAHTVSEVLDLLAFILIFSWAARRLTTGARDAADHHDSPPPRECRVSPPPGTRHPLRGSARRCLPGGGADRSGGHEPGRPAEVVQVRARGHHRPGRHHGHVDEQRQLHPLRPPAGQRRDPDDEAGRERHPRLRDVLVCSSTTARCIPRTCRAASWSVRAPSRARMTDPEHRVSATGLPRPRKNVNWRSRSMLRKDRQRDRCRRRTDARI